MLAMVQSTDAAVAIRFNAWIVTKPELSQIMGFIAYTNLLKIFPFIAVLVWGWHRPPVDRNRMIVLQGMIGACLALGVGRLLPAVLPPRIRPMHDPDLGLLPVPGIRSTLFEGWSSFPSDHGLLFAALAGIGFALSRPVGCGLLAFACLGIWLERVILGYHFASDVIVGSLLGGLCAALALRQGVSSLAAGALLSLSQTRPVWFWTFAMYFLIELADMFGTTRSVLQSAVRVGRYAFAHM